MIGCPAANCDLTFQQNTCDVKGREEQHDPMIMEWDFISEATTRFESLPVKKPKIISEASASSALEHASEDEPDFMTPSALDHASDDDEEQNNNDEEQMSQESADQITAIAFALAKSLQPSARES